MSCFFGALGLHYLVSKDTHLIGRVCLYIFSFLKTLILLGVCALQCVILSRHAARFSLFCGSNYLVGIVVFLALTAPEAMLCSEAFSALEIGVTANQLLAPIMFVRPKWL